MRRARITNPFISETKDMPIDAEFPGKIGNSKMTSHRLSPRYNVLYVMFKKRAGVFYRFRISDVTSLMPQSPVLRGIVF